MAGFSTNDSTSTGTSTSTSNPVQTPQSEWGMQLSQLLATLGSHTYDWAQQQFNSGMGITNENIGHFMELSGRGAGLAQNLINEYQDVFDPLVRQYVADAGSFASEGRQRFMAGQAESTVAQADQQARDEAERKLQGFGINPNSGRYQDLMLTSRVQDAAARAGAGTKAAQDTADRGRAMTEKAIGFGQNIPGMAVNALQSAYTGVTGAENAILGMLNTGANLTNTAAPLMNAASGAIKMPSQAQQAQSKNQSATVGRSSTSDPSGSGKGDKAGQGRQPQEGSGPGNGNSRTPTPPPGSSPINPSIRQAPPGPGITPVKGDPNGGTGEKVENPYIQDNGNVQPYFDPGLARTADGQLKLPGDDFDSAPRADNWLPPATPNFNQGPNGPNLEPNSGGFTRDTWGINSPQPANPDDPFGDKPQYPDEYDNYQPQGPGQSFQDNTFDPFGGQDFSPQQPQQDSYGWDDQYQPESGTQDSSPNDYDFGQDQQPSYQDDTFDPYQDYQEPDQSFDANNDYSYGDDAGTNQDWQGGDWGEDEYARGGKVRPQPRYRGGNRPQKRGVLPTTGGAVSRGASPSRGRQTDDVNARLNAGEFVVPRDVVQDKGTSFFKNLIAKSRKLRTGMTGPAPRPKMRPAMPQQRPSFVSRPMGGR